MVKSKVNGFLWYTFLHTYLELVQKSYHRPSSLFFLPVPLLSLTNFLPVPEQRARGFCQRLTNSQALNHLTKSHTKFTKYHHTHKNITFHFIRCINCCCRIHYLIIVYTYSNAIIIYYSYPLLSIYSIPSFIIDQRHLRMLRTLHFHNNIILYNISSSLRIIAWYHCLL